MISDALSRVLDGHTLRREEMGACFQQVLEGSGAPAQVAALLAALRVRGETVDELVGAAEAVRAAAVRVQAPADVVDTCGTGGDGRGTFNISTAAAIVASAGGVVVAKHGNRSVSSRCGSADVLEALGVQLDRTPEAQARSLVLSRLAFLFAPAHHPAFRHVAALRRELRVRTLFNLVGPLANPAGARRQVVGVFSEALVPKFAEALHRLGAEHALVVHGSGLDELSVVGPTLVDEVRPDGIRRHTLTPEALGLARHAPDTLVGGDAQVNARLLLDVLEGVPGAPRDAVLANAGAALYVGGAAASLADGVALAREVVDSGAAFAHFERFLRAQHTSTRLDEIVSRLPAPAPAKPRRGAARGGARLREALSTGPAPRVIAEVKRRSPSAGPIADIADPAALARQYVERGARAISVLTNAADFGGSLDDLRRVRAAVDVPLLRKDFIVHPAQLDEAAEAGADAVLLIAGLLGGGLARMRAAAEARGLEALVEVHDEAELRLALDAGATLLGVNNRDLRTFEVDLAVSERLAPRIPPHVLVVSESGVRSREALERLRTAGLENFLVGEFLVRGGVL